MTTVYDVDGYLRHEPCTDLECTDPSHLPDRDDDTVWGGLLADEEVES